MTRRRTGYALVESLVVISLLSFTLGAVSLTLHGLRRADQRIRDELEEERVFERLADRLRIDAHESSLPKLSPSDEPGGSAKRLSMSLAANRIVEYTIAGDFIERIVVQGEDIQHRDTFSLRQAALAKWEIDAEQERPLITLWLPLPNVKAAAAVLYPIHAVTGISSE